MKKIRIGSRESRLAVIQSEMVMDYIKNQCPEYEPELVTMKTTGDKILDRTLDKIGGKGLFVKELDAALLDGRSDLSVHSLKDMPAEIPEELPLIGFSMREDPRDVLVLPEGVTELDFSKPVGCSSQRRMLQFQKLYPQAVFAPIRGNVQTRLAKLDSGEFSATILAAAGLKRLGLENRITRYFSVEEMIPGRACWRCRDVPVRIMHFYIHFVPKQAGSHPFANGRLSGNWTVDVPHRWQRMQPLQRMES